MSIFKRTLSLVLAAAVAVSLAACVGGDTDQPSSSTDTTSYREPYVPEEKTNTEVERFVDTDGDFDYKTEAWDGPKGYVIVVPAGDSDAKLAADYLQDYYTRMHEVTLKIVTDSSAEKEKEILIGKTNRDESSSDLKEGEIKVSLQGGKLVFEGGHSVTVEAAVKRFTRLLPDKNEAFTFQLATDFSSTLSIEGLEGYEYVWGDEFEDWYDLDFGKWNFRAGMSGSFSAIISYDRDVIDVSDGRLKIHAINYFDPTQPDVLFKMPWSTATRKTMNYLYGYAEIRARVPFFEGAWPSFWGGTSTEVVPRNPLWHAEVDVFEIFGSEDTVVPNIHKWYDDYPYEEIYSTGDVRHTQYKGTGEYAKTSYVFADSENLDNEYHTYGYRWTPTEMSFYVDGNKYCTMDIVNSWDKEPDMSMFQEPQYHQFNSHVFVTEASFTPNLIYDNMHLLPSEYYIDWFRLYQLDDGKSKIWTDTSARGKINQTRIKEVTIDNE